MKLHFVLNQDQQKHAIVDIFEGQSLISNNLEFALNECRLQFYENGVGNRILLTEKQVWKKLQEVQKRNVIEPVSEKLIGKNFFASIGIICKLNAPYENTTMN